MIAITGLGVLQEIFWHVCMEKSHSYGVTVKTVFRPSSVLIASLYKVDGFQFQFGP